MTRRSAIITIVGTVILATVLALLAFANRNNNPILPRQSLNFSEEGTLAINNLGFKQNTWYFVYDSGSFVELDFESDSRCDIDGVERSCPLGLLNGMAVEVNGVRTDSIVEVLRIEGSSPRLPAPDPTDDDDDQDDDEQGDDDQDDDEDAEERVVKLYYYNPDNDKDENGNVMCTSKGLVAVNRTIPLTTTPIQDTIRLLIQGRVTDNEASQGIETEYPLAGLRLLGANLEGNELTLEFDDPQNRTSGGACRAQLLWMQIEATAKQFSTVKVVRYVPSDIFQP